MAKDIKLLKKLFNQKGGGSGDTNTILLLILVAIIIFFVYFYYNNKTKEITTNQEQYNNTHQITQEPPVIVDDYIRTQHNIQRTLPILRDYDYRTYHDPLTPPYKRDDYMIPAQIVDPVNFGIYTRGVPPVFKKMGYLIDENSTDDKHKFLNLMGRQKFYNSNIYQYYVVSTNRDENIKFDLSNKYKKELYTGDKVKIHQLNNREYTVHIDKDVDYEYNPYVI